MTYLLDTNVLSEYRKPSPDPGVRTWFERVVKDDLYLSVVTIGEIRRGISKLQLRNEHRQAAMYERWLAMTKQDFVDRLVPVTEDVAEIWGHRSVRSAVPTADGLIGATAEAHNWALVTRNVKDFENTGVRLLNPFTG